MYIRTKKKKNLIHREIKLTTKEILKLNRIANYLRHILKNSKIKDKKSQIAISQMISYQLWYKDTN